MRSRREDSSSVSLKVGMPVQAPSTSAICSSPTSAMSSRSPERHCFSFSPRPKPLPDGEFSEMSVEAAEAVKEVDSASDDDVPETDRVTDEDLDRIIDEGRRVSSNNEPHYGNYGTEGPGGDNDTDGPTPGGQPQKE